jgi:serine/threonine protein phosphatase PrpC
MKSPQPPAPPTRFAGVKKTQRIHLDHPYTVRGAWLCHTGKVRRANEDSCLAGREVSSGSHPEPRPIAIAAGPWIVAVSDGIGGHRGGAEASREVVQSLAACTRVTPLAVSETLQKMNRRLCERGRKDSDLAAMGATIAGIGSGGRGLFAFNVGDSRVYRQDGECLVQITRDDSEAEDLIDHGLLQPCDGPRPGFLHALTQAIGGREEVVEIDTHIHPLQVENRARFLICSDGLTDMVHTPEILGTLLDHPDNRLAAIALFKQAMAAGGMDNITLAVIEIARA